MDDRYIDYSIMTDRQKRHAERADEVRMLANQQEKPLDMNEIQRRMAEWVPAELRNSEERAERREKNAEIHNEVLEDQDLGMTHNEVTDAINTSEQRENVEQRRAGDIDVMERAVRKNCEIYDEVDDQDIGHTHESVESIIRGMAKSRDPAVVNPVIEHANRDRITNWKIKMEINPVAASMTAGTIDTKACVNDEIMNVTIPAPTLESAPKSPTLESAHKSPSISQKEIEQASQLARIARITKAVSEEYKVPTIDRPLSQRQVQQQIDYKRHHVLYPIPQHQPKKSWRDLCVIC